MRGGGARTERQRSVGNPGGSPAAGECFSELLSLIRSARTTERLVTAPRGDTYFNERPRGRRGEYLARREAKLANEREGESDGEGKEARPGDHPT